MKGVNGSKACRECSPTLCHRQCVDRMIFQSLLPYQGGVDKNSILVHEYCVAGLPRDCPPLTTVMSSIPGDLLLLRVLMHSLKAL